MDKLYKLRMSGMAEAFEKQLLDPNQVLESFEEHFSNIVNSEWTQRETKKFNRLKYFFDPISDKMKQKASKIKECRVLAIFQAP